jgi:hypothetical protein
MRFSFHTSDQRSLGTPSWVDSEGKSYASEEATNPSETQPCQTQSNSPTPIPSLRAKRSPPRTWRRKGVAKGIRQLSNISASDRLESVSEGIQALNAHDKRVHFGRLVVAKKTHCFGLPCRPWCSRLFTSCVSEVKQGLHSLPSQIDSLGFRLILVAKAWRKRHDTSGRLWGTERSDDSPSGLAHLTSMASRSAIIVK